MNRFFKNNKYAALGVTAFFVIVASGIAIYIIFNFSTILGLLSSFIGILTPIVNGIALAYILTPLLNFVELRWVGFLYDKASREMTEKRKRHKRAFSIIITYVIFGGVVYLFLRLVIPQLLSSLRSIVYQLPRYINNLEALIIDLTKNDADIAKMVDDFFDSIYDEAINFVQNTVIPQADTIIRTLSISVIRVFKSLLNIVIGFIISIYLMYSKELLAGQSKKIVYALLETREANKMISGVRFTHRTFTGFIIGKLIDSAIIGVLCFIVIRIADIPYAILVSVIVGVTNVIPFFGPYLGAIPSTLLILMINPIKALYFVIIILIIQQLDGNVIGPKILGDSTGLSSFWVIFAITVFGGLFGVAGWIIGVPTFAVIYAYVKYLINRKLRDKDLPDSTSPYITVGEIEEDGSFMEYVPDEPQSLLKMFKIQRKSKKSDSN